MKDCDTVSITALSQIGSLAQVVNNAFVILASTSICTDKIQSTNYFLQNATLSTKL